MLFESYKIFAFTVNLNTFLRWIIKEFRSLIQYNSIQVLYRNYKFWLVFIFGKKLKHGSLERKFSMPWLFN